MKKTNKSADGTSFHNTMIKTTIGELVRVLGEPTYQQNTGKDKVNVEWVCETIDGNVVTIYDWKEYITLSENEEILFHLGGHSLIHTLDGKDELLRLLEKQGYVLLFRIHKCKSEHGDSERRVTIQSGGEIGRRYLKDHMKG